MAVFSKLGQELFLSNFLIFLAPADLAQRRVDREPVKPSRELRITSKRLGLAKHRPEDILDHFLGVGGLVKNRQRHIGKFLRVGVENCFQSLRIARLQTLDEKCFIES